MTFELTTWQRLALVGILGRLQGDAALMYRAIQLFDVLELNQSEKDRINLREVGDGMRWDDPDHKWTIILPGGAVELLLVTVEKNRQWPANKAREVEKLFEALGLDWPPSA